MGGVGVAMGSEYCVAWVGGVVVVEFDGPREWARVI